MFWLLIQPHSRQFSSHSNCYSSELQARSAHLHDLSPHPIPWWACTCFLCVKCQMPHSYFILQIFACFIFIGSFYYLFLSEGLAKGFGADQEKKIWLPEAIPYNWFIWAVYRRVRMKRKVPSNRGWHHQKEEAGRGVWGRGTTQSLASCLCDAFQHPWVPLPLKVL